MADQEGGGGGGGGGRGKRAGGWHQRGGGKRGRHGGRSGRGGRGGGGGGAPFVFLQSLRNGRALLATCEVGRERQAAKELRAILERYAEEDGLGRSSSDDEGGEQDDEEEEIAAAAAPAAAAAAGGDGDTAGGSIRDALQREIAELRGAKAQGGKATIMPVDTGCKGTTGVSIPVGAAGGMGPVAASVRMLEEARGGHSSSRCLVKLMPLERICYGGDLPALKAMLRDLLRDKGLLSDDEKDDAGDDKDEASKPKYMISLNRRNFAVHSREEIYQAVGEVIGGRWKVDLKDPEQVIIMEAIRSTIGFSVVDNFNEYRKYNVRQLQDQARGEGQAGWEEGATAGGERGGGSGEARRR